jgi:hypothetical protein
MQQITANVAKGIGQLNEKYRELQPYLDQIDQVSRNVSLNIMISTEGQKLIPH